ncbi:hypothetical protein ACQ4PT_069504 [Festuca glaucescens]
MDAMLPSVPEELPARDWSRLPLDALASVFVSLNAVYYRAGAGLVCLSWRDAAKVPDVWRIVKMDNHNIMVKEYLDKWRVMAKAAIDRSDGQLRVFAGKLFVTEEFLKYIVERSPSLTFLRFVSCFTTLFSARVAGVIGEASLRELRTLELDKVAIHVPELTDVLENCPALEVLTVRYCLGMQEEDEQVLRAKFPRIKSLTFECDDYVFDDRWYKVDLP